MSSRRRLRLSKSTNTNETLEVGDAAGLVFEGRHTPGRARHEHAADPGAQAAHSKRRPHAVGHVHDVRVAAGLELDAGRVYGHGGTSLLP